MTTINLVTMQDGNKARVNQVIILLVALVLFYLYPTLSVLLLCIASPVFNKRTIAFISLFVVLYASVFFATLDPFSDIAEYLNVYNRINDIEMLNFHKFGYGLEVFYFLFMRLVYNISNGSEIIFLFSSYFLMMSLLFYVCFKINSRLSLVIFASVFFSYGFIQSASYLIRQIYSVLFVFLFIMSTSKMKYSFLVMAFLSHLSSFLLYISSVFSVSKHKIVICVVSAIFVGMVFLMTPAWDLLIIKISKIKNYHELNIRQFLIYLFFVLYVFCVNLIFVGEANKDNIAKSLMGIAIFSLLTLVIFKSVPSLPNRLALAMLSFPSLFLYPYLSSHTIKLKNKYMVLMSFIVIGATPYGYAMWNIEKENNNMTFLNNKPISSNFHDLYMVINEKMTQPLHYINCGNKACDHK
ncbi:EpsG family protein [Vibrio tritonius]|uniref:EpsG family protein n=1 Tax=Vibrio tritonius TaxID=1435069 RepID=UPI00315C9C2E